MSVVVASPFASEAELLLAARRLAGSTLAEAAAAVACAWPSEPVRDKGFIGRMIERSLGVHSSPSTSDFTELGVELKTLPVSSRFQPRESTFVCYVALASLIETPWSRSRVSAKLSRVLFVPIESEPGLALSRRRIGSAFFWSPSLEHTGVLQSDYEEIAGHVAAGDERLDARIGRALQLRPKAAHGAVRVHLADGEGRPSLTQPRAFYLRARFTAELLRSSFEPA
ncbi:MAG TPA: MutH/Sau3AI family endonuclease [Polyangiales bacterium]